MFLLSNPRFRALVWVVPVLAFVIACARDASEMPDTASSLNPQEEFWSRVTALCGNAFAGTVAESVPPDTVMSQQQLVMHVRDCGTDTIQIPFHVGTNRSRTWLLTRESSGLRLKHDHRHEDGSSDSVTMYGGDTRSDGIADRQEFLADSLTASLIPAARTNVWTIEILPGQRFVYALRREGSDRRFRAEFDLSSAVPVPPPAWGSTR